ncbi:hypothetical protein [Cellulosilyticum sp. I15G10I2]|uniref:hypothetical protein n=1 Tax=Cellulosilyticum sp. I15G10I2 TaxID=1892843 RepID=UPI00085C3E40|nr:hypothetical protein [Cellulosilyticum sp. I15G10I2]
MKYILIFGVILQSLLYVYKNQEEYEPFYIFKCMIYLFISTIHSVIIMLKLPLGACLMSFIYLIDKKNHAIKLRLIASGIIIVILSSLSYEDISSPIQKLYLYNIKPDVTYIEVYTNNNVNNKYLFSIKDKSDINQWISILKASSPYTSWNYKVLPQDHGYLIKLHYPSKIIPITTTSYTPNLPNVFIGNNYISYTNTSLPDLINAYFNVKPLSLKILSTDVEIKDTSILTNLWEELLWGKEILNPNLNLPLIEGKLSLSKDYEIDISFSNNFSYARFNNNHVIKISDYLSNKLNEQYILSSLNIVNTLTEYAPVHIHTPQKNTLNYSIELDEGRRYHGLYANNEIQNTKTLLHNVSSANSEYFILKNPYILLLDEKLPSQYYLMLINQNIPNKHRYVEKGKNIIPSSIALCPQNTKFTYTINNEDSSTLYLVNNYYDSPIVVANGDILDSLFLSEKYIVYSLLIDYINLLCIYDTSLSKTVKYITIPGNVHMIRVENNTIVFSVQNEDKNILKEGIFIIDDTLKIKKIE